MNNSSDSYDLENNSPIQTNNIMHFEIDSNEYSYLLINNNFCNRMKVFFEKNYIKILEKFISISLHILIMIIFEIYFYFNYVIIIEKNLFIQKINNYLKNIDNLDLNNYEKSLLYNLLNKDTNLLDTLYNNYLNSLNKNNILITQLIYKSSFYASIVGIFFLFFLFIGIYYRKKIKWKWIIWENIMMLVFLGLFEYFFFFNIILKYNPINDDEIKYLIVKAFNDYLQS